MAGPIEDINDAQFESKVTNSDDVVLVDFWAPWCGPCKTLAPFIDRIAQEFQGELRVVKVNVDENPTVSGQLGIRSIPTLILFKKGDIVAEMRGVPDPQKLVDLLEDTLASDTEDRA